MSLPLIQFVVANKVPLAVLIGIPLIAVIILWAARRIFEATEPVTSHG